MAEVKPQILWVDDTPSVLSLGERIFSQTGCTLLTAEDPNRAMVILGRETVHAVISDVEMQRMNGPEFLSHLTKTRKDLFLTIISGGMGRDDTARMIKLLQSGDLHHFVSKPFTPPQIRPIAEVAKAVAADPNIVAHLGGLLDDDSAREEIRMAQLPESIREVVRVLRREARMTLKEERYIE